METKGGINFNSPARANALIEKQILDSIRYYSHNKSEIPTRLAELEEEWDIERTLHMNAAVVALAGTILGATVNRKWLILPALVTLFLSQQATLGWCPPLPLLRGLGFRTAQEIDSEKYALKALQGTLKVGNKSSELFDAVMH